MSDVYLPSPDALRLSQMEDSEVEGTIVEFSDSGQKTRFFAVIDLVRRQTVVVPVERLQAVPQLRPEGGS
jgi:hypothetical protein